MRSLLVVTLVFFSASLAHAQSITHQARFYPAFQQGALVGCQLGFSVLRSDAEFNRGEPVLVNGLVVFYGEQSGHPGVMLRLGAALTSSPDNFVPVERAFLLDGLRTNAAEAGSSSPSEDPGFRIFPFGLGEVTSNAIGRSFAERRLRVSYGMPDTRVDALFEIDLTEQQAVAAQWEECIEAVVSP